MNTYVIIEKSNVVVKKQRKSNNYFHKKSEIKKSPQLSLRTFNLAVPIVPDRCQPSIVGAVGFTSVFGMGTGVSPQLSPPEIFKIVLRNVCDDQVNTKLTYK